MPIYYPSIYMYRQPSRRTYPGCLLMTDDSACATEQRDRPSWLPSVSWQAAEIALISAVCLGYTIRGIHMYNRRYTGGVCTIEAIQECLRPYPFVSTFFSSIFLTHPLLLFLCLLFHLASSLLFPCARYPVWDTHPVHGIPVPAVYTSCPFISSLTCFNGGSVVIGLTTWSITELL